MTYIDLHYSADLSRAVPVTAEPNPLSYGDHCAHRITVSATHRYSAVRMDGSVTADFVRSDGETMTIAGEMINGEAQIILPQWCYSLSGVFGLVVRVTNTDQTTTVLNLRGVIGEKIVPIGNVPTAVEATIASLILSYNQKIMEQDRKIDLVDGAFAKDIEDLNKAIESKAEATQLEALKGDIAEFETIEPFEISLDDIANTDTYPRHMGFINSSGKWTYIGDSRYQYIVVPLQGYGAMAMIVAGGAYAATFAAVKNYADPVSGDTAIFSAEAAWAQKVTVARNGIAALDVPSDATHLLIWVAYSSYGDITPVSFEMTINGKSGKYLTRTGTKWCAMGDSITAGYMSYGTNTDPHYREIKQTCWVTRVADANGWIVTNEGIGGTGWNKPVNADGSQEGESGDAEVDVTSAHALAAIMSQDPRRAFTNFDFVTLAYGINDWKGNRVVGSLDDSFDFDATPTTAIAGMRKTIETIIRNNPAIKIIVVTPLNCVGYYKNGRNPYYSVEANHALGYEYENSGTLESFVSEMIRVCDYYGIQYIDEAHYSCVNRMNIMQMLTDGVHPNVHCHKLIAMEMAKKITIA